MNDFVKKPNAKSEYTNQQAIDLIRCSEDPYYFIENFVKVQHPTKGMLPLKLYPFQRGIIDAYHNHRKSVILCSRQMGKTATAAAYLLWFAMFNSDQTILIAANVLRQALEIMHRIKTAYEECPDHIKAGCSGYAKSFMEFDNGSRIIAQATTANTGRGMSISLLYCDELAFAPPNMVEDMFTSLSPTLATGGKAIITSTPRSDVDMFATIWKGANDNTDEYGNIVNPNGEGANGYFPYTSMWKDHPDRDQEWADKEIATIGLAKFEQEHCNSFVTDEETLVDSRCLARLKVTNPISYTEQVRWYIEPIPNRAYMIALDPSLGTGGDYSAIQVFMLPELIQVAEWQHNMTDIRGQVRVLLQLLHTLQGELMDHPEQHGEPDIYWTIENNSIGEAILQVITDTGEDKFPGTMVSERKKKGKVRRFRKGLTTTTQSKLSSCARLKSLIESDRMVVNSMNCLKELKGFIARGSSYAAKPGSHDDLVSALLLITRMLDIIVAMGTDHASDDLKESISDEEIFMEPMPVVV
jgi:hypothetical protein